MGFLQFEIYVLVSCLCFILIGLPMLWVYGYFNSFSAGTVLRRQNLTSEDVRFSRLKTVPALKGLNDDEAKCDGRMIVTVALSAF